MGLPTAITSCQKRATLPYIDTEFTLFCIRSHLDALGKHCCGSLHFFFQTAIVSISFPEGPAWLACVLVFLLLEYKWKESDFFVLKSGQQSFMTLLISQCYTIQWGVSMLITYKAPQFLDLADYTDHVQRCRLTSCRNIISLFSRKAEFELHGCPKVKQHRHIGR